MSKKLKHHAVARARNEIRSPHIVDAFGLIQVTPSRCSRVIRRARKRDRSRLERDREWPATIRRALTQIGLTPHISTLYLSVTSPTFAAFARSGVHISSEIDLNPPNNIARESRALVVANSQVWVTS